MIPFEFTDNKRSFSEKVLNSYLWSTEPEKMFETIQVLTRQAEEYGIELNYEEFGIISE